MGDGGAGAVLRLDAPGQHAGRADGRDRRGAPGCAAAATRAGDRRSGCLRPVCRARRRWWSMPAISPPRSWRRFAATASQIAGDGLDRLPDDEAAAAPGRGALPARGTSAPEAKPSSSGWDVAWGADGRDAAGPAALPVLWRALQPPRQRRAGARGRAPASRASSGASAAPSRSWPASRCCVPTTPRAARCTRSRPAGTRRRCSTLLGLDEPDRRRRSATCWPRGDRLTYREAIGVLSPDPEGTYFIYRFSDPTFVMAEAVLRALAQEPAAFPGRVLDLCGGSGHLTRVLGDLQPRQDVFLADMFFWKLWLARTFTAPRSVPVCCDANQPLPVRTRHLPDRGAVRRVSLHLAQAAAGRRDDAPGGTGWHDRHAAPAQLARRELLRGHDADAGGRTAISSRKLTPRLFRDRVLFDQAVEDAGIDLTRNVSAEDLGSEPSFTLVAGWQARLFRHYQPSGIAPVTGVLIVNPLYRVERRGTTTELTLRSRPRSTRRSSRTAGATFQTRSRSTPTSPDRSARLRSGRVTRSCGGGACCSTLPRVTADRSASTGPVSRYGWCSARQAATAS